MHSASMTSNLWYEVTSDLETNNAGGPYNPPPYPPDLTTIENFLHSPITENGSTRSQSMDADFKLSDVIDFIETDSVLSSPARPNNLNGLGELPAAHSHMLNGGFEILQPEKAVRAESSSRGAIKKRGKGEIPARRRSHPAKLDSRDVALNGGEGGMVIPRPGLISQLSHQSGRQQPYVTILEQPARKILRFRYLCESRSAGSFPGINSTTDRPTYPTIQIVGYKGKAVVQVSCVSKNKPYRPHPYNLVSKANNDEYKDGICRMKVNTNENYGVIQFKNMGVQCVKRREMAASLTVRQALNVDPFGTGFAHKKDPNQIELTSVRLCFQVFLEGDTLGKINVPLAAVVSDPVYDKRRSADPKIMKLSHCVCSAAGGTQDIILLCEKVTKGDIQVRFHEENDDWEAFADIHPSQIHKTYAISFKAPKYKTVDISDPVRVFVQLLRPSDGAISESVPFEYWPANLLQTEPLKRKRNKKQKLEELKNLEKKLEMQNAHLPSLNLYTPKEKLSAGKRFAHPSGSEVSPFNPFNYMRPSIDQNNWSCPTSPSSGQPSPSAPQQWNIPRSEVLNLPRSEGLNLPRSEVLNLPSEAKATSKPKEVTTLNSGDIDWLLNLVESPSGVQNQLSSPGTNNLQPDPLNNFLDLNTQNNLSLTDSLTRLAMNDFFPNP